MSQVEPPPSDAPAVFSPDRFFTQPYWGAGVVMVCGIPVRRFKVRGEGRTCPEGYIFTKRFERPNGSIHVAEWLVARNGDQYSVLDLKNGAQAVGRYVGADFEWNGARPVKTPFGVRSVRLNVRYAVSSPSTVVSTASWLVGGLPVLRVVSFLMGAEGSASTELPQAA